MTTSDGNKIVVSSHRRQSLENSKMDTSESNQTIMTVHTDLVSPITGDHNNASRGGVGVSYRVVPRNNNNNPVEKSPQSRAHSTPSRKDHFSDSDSHPVIMADSGSPDESCFRLTSSDGNREPICIVLFKWFLIIAGSIMLCIVIFIMGDVLVAWIGSEPREHQSPSIKHSINLTNSDLDEAVYNSTAIYNSTLDDA